ncbi:MAG: hypothetical protein HY698_15220 [Deltaproteobacteria bacterium]|nr:hypothetical protein [Deltaproteobacteria bacterium]
MARKEDDREEVIRRSIEEKLKKGEPLTVEEAGHLGGHKVRELIDRAKREGW